MIIYQIPCSKSCNTDTDPALDQEIDTKFYVVKFIIFFFLSFRLALGYTQPPIQSVTVALSMGVKRQGRETDHSSPTSAGVKKMWIYTSTTLYAFMA
jgi:hypothetical protein